MLGVVEADCLEPTHNKQAFNTTDIAYQKCQKHLEKSMNDYYFGVQNLRLAGIGAGGKRRTLAPKGGTSKKGKDAKGKGKGLKGKGKGKNDDGLGESDDDDAWVAKVRPWAFPKSRHTVCPYSYQKGRLTSALTVVHTSRYTRLTLFSHNAAREAQRERKTKNRRFLPQDSSQVHVAQKLVGVQRARRRGVLGCS
jgi:hypothetical protein|tara:strand:- start:12464 stop:13048 length:585 start_codon:yes stop_codon:yes gene_type:complete